MAGVEDIVGKTGNYNVRDKFKRFDNKFIRPLILKYAQVNIDALIFCIFFLSCYSLDLYHFKLIESFIFELCSLPNRKFWKHTQN